MAVPVVLGASSFDFTGLRAEQSRLAKFLVKASPRDINDTSAVLEIDDDETPPNKYPVYIKSVLRDDGSGSSDFHLYMKDNFDQEFRIGTTTTTFPTPAANVAGATIAINGGTGNIPSDFMIDSRTGEIFKSRQYNAAGALIDPDGGGPFVIGGNLIGMVKFDGATGLELATINDRIADISNAVEGMTKILGVVSGNLDTAVNLIR